MSKKLSGNGLWESSRMMLPEHKEAILEANHDELRHSKPVLHVDEIQEINKVINESLQAKSPVNIIIFGEWGNREVIGVVSGMNQFTKKVKVELSEDRGFEWIDFDEILNAEIVDSHWQ